jgi:hypothetical protein
LAATLIFGGEFGSRKITTESTEDGTFELEIPGDAAATWDVDVRTEAPPLRRELHDIRADRQIEIDLPLTVLSGEVIDMKGAPVADVLVNIVSVGVDGERQQQPVASDGTFAMHGLAPGRYAVRADGFLKESDRVEVSIADDGTSEPLRLVVRPSGQLTGVVRSSAGFVPGAQVVALPTDVPFLYAMEVTTNDEGEFATVIPPTCREVDVIVAAPGFPFQLFHALLTQRRLSIVARESGGTLTARWSVSDRHPFIGHSGAWIDPSSLAVHWPVKLGSSATAGELVAPLMESGTYSLCMLTAAEGIDVVAHRAQPAAEHCMTTYLPPFGTAMLELR